MSQFKVVIAGGGIAGLTLASALEKAGVDYVLLEKRDIAPDLGASITSLPCTTVVHEQLGFGHIVADATLPLLAREHYSEKGRRFARSNETTLLLERYKSYRNNDSRTVAKILTGDCCRAGRPMIFMQRQFLLQQLYESISNKTKVKARTGLLSYTEDDEGITVVTDTEETIRGSILIGADGIHSAVRRMMAQAYEKKSADIAKDYLEGKSWEQQLFLRFCATHH